MPGRSNIGRLDAIDKQEYRQNCDLTENNNLCRLSGKRIHSFKVFNRMFNIPDLSDS